VIVTSIKSLKLDAPKYQNRKAYYYKSFSIPKYNIYPHERYGTIGIDRLVCFLLFHFAKYVRTMKPKPAIVPTYPKRNPRYRMLQNINLISPPPIISVFIAMISIGIVIKAAPGRLISSPFTPYVIKDKIIKAKYTLL
jgi:hypothetical protein